MIIYLFSGGNAVQTLFGLVFLLQSKTKVAVNNALYDVNRIQKKVIHIMLEAFIWQSEC
jgi:hypothetical protein